MLREEIGILVNAINEEVPGAVLRLRDDEFTQLEDLLRQHPDVWPIGLADTFKQLKRKLRLETIDRQALPDVLVPFFEEKFKRDLDPMALARAISHDIAAGCAECECKC